MWSFVTSQKHVFRVHLCCDMYQHFIPFIAKYCSIVWIQHIVFIHASVHRHLGFHFWAMMNNSAMDRRV